MHITDIVAKAHKRGNVLLCCFVSRDVDMLTRAYLVYVRPLLEVNSVIWSPHYKQDIDLIERVQTDLPSAYPAIITILTMKDSPLTLLNLPSLELRRLRFDLIWYYKILFGLISIDSADLFEVRQTTVTRGHPCKLFKPQCTINARSSFFTQRIINVWNDLPVNTTNYFSSLNCFRNSLNKVDLSNYLVRG